MALGRLSRRDFGFLSMAAFGGMIAGCGGDDAGSGSTGSSSTGSSPGSAAGSAAPADSAGGEQVAAATAEAHVCRGLNACSGQGQGGGNGCAGQGSCATAASHSCQGQNDCKGQGGCGETPGANECKGQGSCAVPLSDDAWTKARALFEAKMKEAGTAVGAAPAKAG